MKLTPLLAACAFCGLASAPLPAASAQDNQVSVKLEMLRDDRGKGLFHSLDVSLRVEGGDTQDSLYVRARAKVATDSTGQNLLVTPQPREIIEKARFEAKPAIKSELTKIELLNPARQATHLAEVSGVVQLFFPQRDDQSLVTIDNIHLSAGRLLESPILKASNLEITFFTKAQADAPGAEKIRVADDEIGFRIKDPNQKLVDIVFEDEDGKKLNWRSRSLGFPTQATIFSAAIPDRVRARIYVATAKSLVEIPFQFSELALP